jgi:hypothetical protein
MCYMDGRLVCDGVSFARVISPRIRLGSLVMDKVSRSVYDLVANSVSRPVRNSVKSSVDISVSSSVYRSVYRSVTNSINNRL